MVTQSYGAERFIAFQHQLRFWLHKNKIIAVRRLFWHMLQRAGERCVCVPSWLRRVLECTSVQWNPVTSGAAVRRVCCVLRRPSTPAGCVLRAEHSAAPSDSRSHMTEQGAAVGVELERDRRIGHDVVYTESHKPKKRLLFPSRGAEERLMCLFFLRFLCSSQLNIQMTISLTSAKELPKTIIQLIII